MFVTFANIEEPNSLTDEEARGLHAELLSGTPSITHTQTAQKIQRAWEQTGEVNLNHDEKRVLVEVLNRQGPGGPTPEPLRWLQRNIRRSLGEDVH
ncbi:MAG TPA: hypothetical protein VIM33_01060 [Gaiellaceae bacterium]|jgi:hypothetical protein